MKNPPPPHDPLVSERDIAADFREVVRRSILYQESLILTVALVTGIKHQRMEVDGALGGDQDHGHSSSSSSSSSSSAV